MNKNFVLNLNPNYINTVYISIYLIYTHTYDIYTILLNNNIEDNGTATSSEIYTYNSGFGNRSKVEIISKTQLLTARGYKV